VTAHAETAVTARTVEVFFYGLCMDMGLLQQRGLAPSHPQVVYGDGDDIAMRERATLVPNAAARVYGMLAGVTQTAMATLYAAPSVLDSRPEAVLVTLGDGRQGPALGSNLPQVTGTPRHPAYAVTRLELAKMLAFPGASLDTLQGLVQEETTSSRARESTSSSVRFAPASRRD
jgi:hypothetical protein